MVFWFATADPSRCLAADPLALFFCLDSGGFWADTPFQIPYLSYDSCSSLCFLSLLFLSIGFEVLSTLMNDRTVEDWLLPGELYLTLLFSPRLVRSVPEPFHLLSRSVLLRRCFSYTSSLRFEIIEDDSLSGSLLFLFLFGCCSDSSLLVSRARSECCFVLLYFSPETARRGKDCLRFFVQRPFDWWHI